MAVSSGNPFGQGERTDASSAWGAPVVTPNDSVDLPGGVCKGLYIGVAGTLSYVDGAGNTVTGTTVVAGVFPICVVRVKATSTSATSILALYGS